MTIVSDARLRSLRHELSGAADEQVHRVVAMVDSLAVRGDADALVAPLRPRLARLRPARPLSLTRLLFIPADPVILPASRWRRGAPGLPRTALMILAREVQGGLDDADAIAERARGLTTQQVDAMMDVGAALWPRAGAILRSLAMPADWTAQTGLPGADFSGIAMIASSILGVASGLLALGGLPAVGETVEAAVQRLLHEIEPGVSAAGAATLAQLIVARAPLADRALLALQRAAGPFREAATVAVAGVLERMVTELPGEGDVGGAAQHLTRAGALLADLERFGEHGPAPRATLQSVRHDLDERARQGFATMLGRAVPEWLAGQQDPAELEAAARDLRRLETASRRIGSAAFYDKQMSDLLPQLAQARATPVMERMRLVEILAGPEEAWELVCAGK